MGNPDVGAVYVAVPHHLHREVFRAVIEASKHLMGMKSFGMDLPANTAIFVCLVTHPGVLARCVS